MRRRTDLSKLPSWLPLLGTVALVTGASSGIGAATARQLSANGAAVALAARRKDRLENLAKEIGDAGGASLVIERDVTNQDEAADAVERTVSELGRLDTLVNNAGVMLLFGSVPDAPLSEAQCMVELNILGFFYRADAATPHLLRAATDGPRHVADMVNVSSVAGRVPPAVATASTASPSTASAPSVNRSARS